MEDEKYMWRCIGLALNGAGGAPPNPMVGAVIVCDGKIIGEGYHVRAGEAHAEVMAFRSVKDEYLLKRSTLYVSLEPCSHYGKTPPCVDLIIKKEVPRVVVGCVDPFEEVSGRGIGKLREAGREVTVGVLEAECRHLIRRFITFHTLRRPYIVLKWAESADGFIDLERTGGTPALLSTPLTSMLVHKSRSESDAILVGTQTALLDNPSLTVRHWWGKNPVRVVIDRELSLPPELNLFDGSVRTLVFTARTKASVSNTEYITLDFEVDILPQLLGELHARGLQSLMVEGGARLLQSFIDAGLWDEAFVERAKVWLCGGVKAPVIGSFAYRAMRFRFGVETNHYMIES